MLIVALPNHEPATRIAMSVNKEVAAHLRVAVHIEPCVGTQ
jgi:hypothetical protein